MKKMPSIRDKASSKDLEDTINTFSPYCFEINSRRDLVVDKHYKGGDKPVFPEELAEVFKDEKIVKHFYHELKCITSLISLDSTDYEKAFIKLKDDFHKFDNELKKYLITGIFYLNSEVIRFLGDSNKSVEKYYKRSKKYLENIKQYENQIKKFNSLLHFPILMLIADLQNRRIRNNFKVTESNYLKKLSDLIEKFDLEKLEKEDSSYYHNLKQVGINSLASKNIIIDLFIDDQPEFFYKFNRQYFFNNVAKIIFKNESNPSVKNKHLDHFLNMIDLTSSDPRKRIFCYSILHKHKGESICQIIDRIKTSDAIYLSNGTLSEKLVVNHYSFNFDKDRRSHINYLIKQKIPVFECFKLSIKRISDYKIMKKLEHEGNTSNIYLAKKRSVKEYNPAYILKEINFEEEGEENILDHKNKLRRMFVNDLRRLMELNHPNIARIIDYTENNKNIILVQKYYEKGNLKDYEGKLNINQMFTDFLEGLSYIHKMRYIHCDVKPENIFLTKGIEKIVIGDLQTIVKSNNKIIDYSGKYGRGRSYSAPELILENKFCFQSDVYSSGLVLLNMITREHLPEEYQAKSLKKYKNKENCHKKLMDNLIENLDTSEHNKKILTKCLAYDPKDRFKNATDLLYSYINKK